jgi:hypothetical protein
MSLETTCTATPGMFCIRMSFQSNAGLTKKNSEHYFYNYHVVSDISPDPVDSDFKIL